MLGLVIGTLCGAAELVLLRQLIGCMLGGHAAKVVLLISLKLAVLVGTLAVVVIFARQDLAWCGVGIAGCLIGGSVVLFLKNAGMKGGKN
ncbi:hypothetical protein SDC9_145642 [bioreactor metagenome]|uniref:Uncharacterized protein n=1 Tax=bioreactor metagenome TaxID=1076179 RepID=A0A645E8Y4_9ZZZZ